MSVVITSKVFQKTSEEGQYPEATVHVDAGYTLVGGGATDNWSGCGNILTDTYPVADGLGNYTGWYARGKDCWVVSQATLTTYAIGIKVTRDGVDVPVKQKVWTATANVGEVAVAQVDAGWASTCGGASVSPNNGSLLLQASSPKPDPQYLLIENPAWHAAAQYCQQKESGTVTAYVIGVQAGGITFSSKAAGVPSQSAQHPSTSLNHGKGQNDAYVGGGAWDGLYEADPCFNFLTSSEPMIGKPAGATDWEIIGWSGAGKDHMTAWPAKISVCIVSLHGE